MKRSLNEVIDLDFASKRGPVLNKNGLFVLGNPDELNCEYPESQLEVTNCDLKLKRPVGLIGGL